MKLRWLALLTAVFYLLHQDFWFWRSVQPVFFGVLPVGLFYQVCFSLAASLLMWLLAAKLWPAHLDTDGVTPGERPDAPR